MRSADRILPEYQRLDVGDVIPLGPDVGIPVRRLEPGAVLGLRGTMDPAPGRSPLRRCTCWPAAGTRLDICAQPVDERTTRLLSRTRYDYSPLPVGLILRPVLEPMQFIMERRMLLGIKSLAEGRDR